MGKRQELAERLAKFLTENDLTTPYGGDVSLITEPKHFYTVTFSKPRNLDGVIAVYSANFIRVKYRSRYLGLPHDDARVFNSEENAINFLRLAFVEHKFDEAIEIPTR